jgi:hypothetical protein
MHTEERVNDEFLRMLQYDHDDVAAGRLNWAEFTPPLEVRSQPLCGQPNNAVAPRETA